MDIYRFVNSKDVADHLRATDYHLTAGQAAYLVHKSEDATLAERLDAWRDIVAEMPDGRLHTEKGVFNSVHELVEDHVRDKEWKLERFLDGDGAAYFPYESRWSQRPSWVPDGWCAANGLWNTLRMPVPFSSLDGCRNYLRREGEILEHGWRLDTLHERMRELVGEGGSLEDFHNDPDSGVRYDRHVVCRVAVDEGWYSSYGHVNDSEPQCTPLDYVVLNGDLEILDVAWGWKDMVFDYMTPAIPIPFRRGDVVIDRTARVPRPFVFDFAIPWAVDGDGLARVDEEGHRALLRGLFKDDRRAVAASNIEAYYDWRTTAYGYEIEDGTGIIEVKAFGASRNYLNLEYYDGPLDGELRQLATVSELVKGELDFGVAANFNRLAAMGNHARAMLR